MSGNHEVKSNYILNLPLTPRSNSAVNVAQCKFANLKGACNAIGT